MSDSTYEISAEGRRIDEGGAYSVRSRQVIVLENGDVRVMHEYQSFDDYLRDLGLHKTDKDRLSALPTEILSQIVEYVIPNRGRIAIGIDWFGTNQTHIEGGSLNILCVSRSISIIGLHLLYGCRRYEVAAENNLHSPRREQADVAMMMKSCSRYRRLRETTNPLHPTTTPTDCLDLLIRHTPAQTYMTILKIKINELTRLHRRYEELVHALRHAKGLLVLELELLIDVPNIIGFVHQLRHIREIKLLLRCGQTECYEREMALRNEHWVQPREEAGNSRDMTPEPGWVVLEVIKMERSYSSIGFH